VPEFPVRVVLVAVPFRLREFLVGWHTYIYSDEKRKTHVHEQIALKYVHMYVHKYASLQMITDPLSKKPNRNGGNTGLYLDQELWEIAGKYVEANPKEKSRSALVNRLLRNLIATKGQRYGLKVPERLSTK
jgi:hypothetical protein